MPDLKRPDAAIENLTNHQVQADFDGIMVAVSREALSETLDYLATRPAPPADAIEAVAMPIEIVEFLMGQGPLEGEQFGEKHESRRGNFWWRSVIRERLKAQDQFADAGNMIETSGYAEDHLYVPKPEITDKQWDQLKTPTEETRARFQFDEDWCIAAAAAGGCETGAGLPDHPLRTGTTHCEAGCKYGVESKHSDHCNSSLGNVIDAPVADSGLVADELYAYGQRIRENAEMAKSIQGFDDQALKNSLEHAGLIERAVAALKSPDRELLREVYDECAKLALNESNYGHIEGNARAFKIHFEIKQRKQARLEAGGE